MLNWLPFVVTQFPQPYIVPYVVVRQNSSNTETSNTTQAHVALTSLALEMVQKINTDLQEVLSRHVSCFPLIPLQLDALVLAALVATF